MKKVEVSSEQEPEMISSEEDKERGQKERGSSLLFLLRETTTSFSAQLIR
jgi:hypothetical protein